MKAAERYLEEIRLLLRIEERDYRRLVGRVDELVCEARALREENELLRGVLRRVTNDYEGMP